MCVSTRWYGVAMVALSKALGFVDTRSWTDRFASPVVSFCGCSNGRHNTRVGPEKLAADFFAARAFMEPSEPTARFQWHARDNHWLAGDAKLEDIVNLAGSKGWLTSCSRKANRDSWRRCARFSIRRSVDYRRRPPSGLRQQGIAQCEPRNLRRRSPDTCIVAIPR